MKQANQDILKVPTSTLRSIAKTPNHITTALPNATVHAILSTSLCLDTSADLLPWRGVFPSKADIHAALPICWPAELRALLPSSASAILARQSAKFNKDWALVEAAFPNSEQITKEDFLYSWLLVNTRTFYHTTRKTEKLPREDHMVLQPVADLFNHSPNGSTVSYNDKFFTITTTRAHCPGDELFIKYGPHANDFLLVEYGFTLPPPLNPWDETCLDPYLCPALIAARQKDRLEEAGFWGKYMLDAETACYRTHVALRTLCLTPLQWQAVLDGERDEDRDKARVDAELVQVLKKYETDIREKLAEVEKMTAGEELSREVLVDRWLQIKELVVGTIRRLES